ncbi:MAG: hypothetical protein LAT76_03945 [Schleiferiaceae bacterium]|nr:hypothetical protein [Schleiferiaceae bacterium]
MERLRQAVSFLGGFFPIRLLLLHLRRSLLLMLFWVLLFGLVGGWWLSQFGFQYLFCTPEYLERVQPLAYFFMGLAVGLFVMAFHIASYIFYSYRFSFLAALDRPLFRFSINNSVIPIAFYIFYSIQIYQQLQWNGASFLEVFLSIAAVLLGSIIMIAFVFFYFFSTIKTAIPSATEVAKKIETPLKALIKKDKKLDADERLVEVNRVHSYLKNFYSIRPTRSVRHYSEAVLLQTLQKHHLSAALFFVTIGLLLLSLGFLGDKELLMLPAGSSLVLLLTFAIMIAGAFYSWLKTWAFSIGLVLVLGLNYFSGLPRFVKTYAAFGLNYQEPPKSYTTSQFEALLTDSIASYDEAVMLEALDNWRAKFPKNKNPQLILVNSSGGGLRSTVWSFGIMQQLDEATSGAFMNQLFGVFGSSGGMIGAAYMRELHLEKALGATVDIYDPQHLAYIGKDVLNPVAFYLATNDVAIRLKTFSDGAYKYYQDRGFAFERQLNKNLNGAFHRRIGDYKDYEHSAMVPHLFLTPTIVQDGRRLLIASKPVSFLMRSGTTGSVPSSYQIDGLDFMRFFEKHDAPNLRFSTALRMSASFPYITPLVSLPTRPAIDIIDAGARDNEGFGLTIRFLHTFKDWIQTHTSGVTVVRLKANAIDEISIDTLSNKSLIENWIRPVGGVVNSYGNFQYFAKAQYLELSQEWLSFPLDFATFSLLTLEDQVSLSWHLTQNERETIAKEIQSKRIKTLTKRLQDRM